MSPLGLHEFHAGLGAQFTAVNGAEAVEHYGDVSSEHAALLQAAGVIDLSFRSRLCLLGKDRIEFLHGQVTNDVKALKSGEGCYAALVSAKGRMQSDLNIYRLADELLLDFEPGLTAKVSERLDKFIIAADVQIVDVAPHYGLLSVQGPRSAEMIGALGWLGAPPSPISMSFVTLDDPTLGSLYLMHLPRTGSTGFDLFVPGPSLSIVAGKLIAAAKQVGGRACGWDALEIARIEAGLPRFGADLDESNLPPEAGPALEARAISYTKGCHIGQEVLARIRTYGQVAKELHGLMLPDQLAALPERGDKLFKDGREVGFVTSSTRSLVLGKNIALGFVRREVNQIASELIARTTGGDQLARIVRLPFA